MTTLLVRRLLLAALNLLLVSIVIFAAVEVIPGDAAANFLGQDATPAALAALRQRLGLDAPAWTRYLAWLSGVLQGDLGQAMSSSRPIVEILGPRVHNSLILSAVALLLYVPISIVPAAVGARFADRPLDHGISMVTLVIMSMPSFLVATLLLVTFAWLWPVLPVLSHVTPASSVRDWTRALALPAATLALVMAAYAIRMLRDNLIEVLRADFVTMAELKGLSPRAVLLRHALPNALQPTFNITALNIAYLASGVVIVEKVFAFPGFGSLLVDALLLKDVPLILATVLLASLVYVLANLLADLGSLLLNPKLRTRRA